MFLVQLFALQSMIKTKIKLKVYRMNKRKVILDLIETSKIPIQSKYLEK